MTIPMQLGYFIIVTWVDTENSPVWQSDATDIIPICKR